MSIINEPQIECPECEGMGKYTYMVTSTESDEEVCSNCEGKGCVPIPDMTDYSFKDNEMEVA